MVLRFLSLFESCAVVALYSGLVWWAVTARKIGYRKCCLCGTTTADRDPVDDFHPCAWGDYRVVIMDRKIRNQLHEGGMRIPGVYYMSPNKSLCHYCKVAKEESVLFRSKSFALLRRWGHDTFLAAREEVAVKERRWFERANIAELRSEAERASRH